MLEVSDVGNYVGLGGVSVCELVVDIGKDLVVAVVVIATAALFLFVIFRSIFDIFSCGNNY